ncbi:MAG: hypothetical protein AB7F31_01315 [Parachlamydiales bacterium]
MRKISITSFICALLLTVSLFGAHPLFSRYPKEMEGAVEAISALPEAKALLDTVYREGRVELISEHGYGNFSAFWVGGRRAVCVPDVKRKEQGELIRSILFELHNAKANGKLATLDRQVRGGKISRAAFVEGVERIEFQNVQEACALLRRGVARGIFPKTALWEMPTQFDEYYLIQQRAGHSAWIGHRYDQMIAGRT